MKRFRCRFLFVTVGLATTFSGPCARAQGLITGHYRFEVELSPVCLDGAYPFSVGDLDGGTLALSTDAAGNLTGRADLRSVQTSIAGKMLATSKKMLISIAGTDPELAFKARGSLQGDRLGGMAKANHKAEAAELEVAATAALRVKYDLALIVAANGKVTGTGTATAAGESVPVKVKGRNRASESLLRVNGGRTLWMGSGPLLSTGFTAKWSAHAFGGARKGGELVVVAE